MTEYKNTWPQDDHTELGSIQRAGNQQFRGDRQDRESNDDLGDDRHDEQI